MLIFLSIWAPINAVIGVFFFAISRSAIASIESGIAFLIRDRSVGVGRRYRSSQSKKSLGEKFQSPPTLVSNSRNAKGRLTSQQGHLI